MKTHRFTHPFGHCVSVDLSEDGEDPAWERVTGVEKARAATFGPARVRSWLGGRVALHTALDDLGIVHGDILPDVYGAPDLPPPVRGSLTHTRRTAVALVFLPSTDCTVGIDLEELDRDRDHLARYVLTERERVDLGRLPPAMRGRSFIRSFAVKEAIYKAIHPRLTRYVGFGEVAVVEHPDGRLEIAWHLKEGQPPRRIDVHCIDWRSRAWLCAVRARWD